MKLPFLAALMFVNILIIKPQKPQSVFKVTTFTDVPKGMEGCGEYLFVNNKMKRQKNLFFIQTMFEV
jgi:hypothetical protein